MLNNIHISNYRTFSSLEVDLSSRINLIVGANNSGKSSLLEAIYLLTGNDPGISLLHLINERGEALKRSKPVSYTNRGSDHYQVSNLFFGRIAKVGQEVNIRSSSKLQTNFFVKKIDSKLRNEIIHLRYPYFQEEDGVGFGGIYEVLIVEGGMKGNSSRDNVFGMLEDGVMLVPAGIDLNRFGTSEQRAKFITTNFVGYNEIAALWDNITLTPREEQVIEALRILEPDVERISFTSRQSSDNGVLLKMRGEYHPVSLGSMGDGMRRSLVIAAALVSVENGILLIDEIDTGLYHDVLADIWKLILETSAQRNVKVFATTHSWDCVRAFQAALKKRDEDNAGQLIRLEKQKSGLVRPIHYSTEELEIAIRQNIEVR